MTLKSIQNLHPFIQLAVIPVLGALFLVFLPVIGFALLGQLVVQRIGEAIRPLAVTAPAPGAAYLTGSESKYKSIKDTLDELDQLQRDVDAQRKR